MEYLAQEERKLDLRIIELAQAGQHEAAADLTRAQFAVKDFMEKYSVIQERREKAIRRAMLRYHSSNFSDYGHTLPRIFINDEPIKRLFIYNLPFRMTKVRLYQILAENDCNNRDVTIVKIFCKDIPGSAEVVCDSLHAAIKLQCKARLGQLIVKCDKRCTQLMVKPDRAIVFSKFGRSDAEQMTPAVLQSLLTIPPIARNIVKHLDSTDFLTLYSAFPDIQANLIKMKTLEFSTDHPRYRHAEAHLRMVEDGTNFKLSSIRFIQDESLEIPLSASIAKNILEKQIALNGDQQITYEEIDLTGVETNDTIIRLLTQRTVINRLSLGNSRKIREAALALLQCTALHVLNNPFVRLSFLKAPPFKNITSLQLVECKKLIVQHLIEFVKNNTILELLQVTDCDVIDKETPIVTLVQHVFSGNTSLKTFHFNYKKMVIEPLIFEYQPRLQPLDSLMDLDMSANTQVSGFLPSILANAPNIKRLRLKSLKFESTLDFSQHMDLAVLQIDHGEFTMTSLTSISSTNLCLISVENKLGKSNRNNKNIVVENLRSLWLGNKSVRIEFVNCDKVVITSRLQNKLQSDRFRILRHANTVQICEF